MKKTHIHLLCGAVLAGLLAGCGGNTSLLHSGDHNLMYAKALEFYEAEKWSRASTLFENIEHIYDGSPREDSIAFFNARCKYKSREWDAAAELLDRFRRKFGRSVFIEDAEGMYAMCFYYLSPGPTRDQTMTVRARTAIHEFTSRYPASDRTEDFRKIDDELLHRLHDKAYTNAYTYYKTGRYKSAIVALRNALKQYPESSHREQIMYLTVVSGFRLADNSVQSKQTDRFLSMLDSYYSFIEEYPESEHRRELDRMAQRAKDYLDKNNKEKTE